jgi:hypothetical protein
MILGPGRDVFDLSKEEAKLRDRYGRHTFGQDCLAARRMVEAGVPYITINYPGGWDTHSNHFSTMRQAVPAAGSGVGRAAVRPPPAALLESTLVWCCGEFGRSPKVDWQPPWNGGRNHFGSVFSVLVAGGGFKGGQVVGASTEKGEEVKDRPVYPVDLLGSIYRAGRHRRRRQAPASRGPRRPRAGHDGVRRQGGGAAEGDHVGGGQGSAFRCQP